MHNLTNIDTVFQLENAFSNISGHSKKSIFLYDQVSQKSFIIWREALRLFLKMVGSDFKWAIPNSSTQFVSKNSIPECFSMRMS